jgi:hypothetical protein
MHPIRMNTQMFQKISEQEKLSPCQVIATNIVAFTRVSPGYEQTISTLK